MGTSVFEREDSLRRLRLLPQKFPAKAAIMFEEKISSEDFLKWLIQSKIGERITYITGAHLPSNKPEIAELAYQSCEAGQVYLVQQRTEAPGIYDYLAVKAPPKQRK